jgi:hypothetical protein
MEFCECLLRNLNCSTPHKTAALFALNFFGAWSELHRGCAAASSTNAPTVHNSHAWQSTAGSAQGSSAADRKKVGISISLF